MNEEDDKHERELKVTTQYNKLGFNFNRTKGVEAHVLELYE